MTSALDIAREVAPGLDWLMTSAGARAVVAPHGPTIYIGVEPAGWYAFSDATDIRRDRDPRACLRSVLDDVQAWALAVFRATAPPEATGEEPDPVA